MAQHFILIVYLYDKLSHSVSPPLGFAQSVTSLAHAEEHFRLALKHLHLKETHFYAPAIFNGGAYSITAVRMYVRSVRPSGPSVPSRPSST